jgi:hypothetical protein
MRSESSQVAEKFRASARGARASPGVLACAVRVGNTYGICSNRGCHFRICSRHPVPPAGLVGGDCDVAIFFGRLLVQLRTELVGRLANNHDRSNYRTSLLFLWPDRSGRVRASYFAAHPLEPSSSIPRPIGQGVRHSE